MRSADAEAAPPPAATRPPNIVFFLCDDLGTGDVGALGGKDIQTPNIDAPFARGTRLAWHWAGSAVCAPSRCVLLTGKHPGHAVVRSNREVKPGIRCVRQGDWKRIKYESPAGGLVTQLFNLAENPAEFLADDPAHAETCRELEVLLLAEMERLHDPYRFSDQTSGPPQS